MKNIGDKVDDLLGLDQNGNEVRLSQYPGRTIALYFYPKDMTPGCTAEACNLRDNYSDLIRAGYQVIGVSTDTAERHQKFIGKNSLPFPLVADTDHRLADEFGVWQLKKLAGRSYMGIVRTTFIIGSDATVERVISKVNTKDHTAQILG